MKTESEHDFPFINILKVPRQVLKTQGETMRMLMNDKIMFDCYFAYIQQNISKMKKILAHYIS